MGFKIITKEPEYNIPSITLATKYYDILHADIKFNLKERKEIEAAVQEWNLFCNGFIVLDLVFDYDDEDYQPLPKNRAIIIKANEQHSIIKNYELKNKCLVVGFCHIDNDNGTDIYLLYKRINKFKKSNNNWKTVTMHEIGHYLGMRHVDAICIMHPTGSNYLNSLTEKDAEEFCRIYNVDIKELFYIINSQT